MQNGLPQELATPGEIEVVTLHAQGAQIYECRAGEAGALAWATREPVAALLLDGKTVGRHYAGPNWEHIDGSAVAAKLAARVAAPSASDIPWLKLDVTERRGKGVLSEITTILRINTKGGVAPGACDKAGSLISVAYSTDYVFLARR